MDPETRPAPDWAGDVSLGVDVWTQRSAPAAPPPGPSIAFSKARRVMMSRGLRSSSSR